MSLDSCISPSAHAEYMLQAVTVIDSPAVFYVLVVPFVRTRCVMILFSNGSPHFVIYW